MFRNSHYEIHHVVIIEVDNGLNIVISMIYDNLECKVKVTGIHLDKRLLFRQHQWISLKHMNECTCFDNYNWIINDISIGNPDDNLNRINALKKSKVALEQQIERLRNKLKSFD